MRRGVYLDARVSQSGDTYEDQETAGEKQATVLAKPSCATGRRSCPLYRIVLPLHTKDFVKHYNNSPAENLSEEMRDAKGQFDSSSDLTFTENWMIAEGDKVAVCFTAKGTHDGVFQGVPATGKHYELSAITVWRFMDGKIAEEWVFFNDLDLYRQIGLFKAPGSTDH